MCSIGGNGTVYASSGRTRHVLGGRALTGHTGDRGIMALRSLARLRFEDPQAAASAADGLWAQLAIEDPRMFAALWRRANKPSRRAGLPRWCRGCPGLLPAVEAWGQVPVVEGCRPYRGALLPAVNLAPPAIVLTAPSLELPAARLAPASW